MNEAAVLPVLYSFRRCPYAIRARLALAQADEAVEIREIVLRDKPAEMVRVSPKATVPVLVLPDGAVIDQSLEIMLWALHRHDPEGWLTAAPLDEQLALVAINDGEFKRLLDRYKYPERYPQDSAANYRDAAVDLLLAQLDRRLGAGPFIAGSRCGIADMALLPFVRQFAAVDAGWFENSAPLPQLREWLQRLLATPLFEAVMVKRPVWIPPRPAAAPVQA